MGNFLIETLVRAAYKMAGLDSPYSRQEYGANWTKQRQKCLERDSRECQICGTHESEIGREPAVHHITPRIEYDTSEWRTYNDLSNLVTLCHSCHGTHEGRYTNENVDGFIEKVNQGNV